MDTQKVWRSDTLFYLSFDSEFPLWEGPHFSEFLSGLQTLFVRSQGSSDGAGLLGTKIQRLVFLTLQYTKFTFKVADKSWQSLSNELHKSQWNSTFKRKEEILTLYNLRKFSFCFWCITMLTRAMDLVTTRILLNFEAAPPVTLATLRLPSSVLRSSSCLTSSSFFLVLNSEHLIRGWKRIRFR